MMIQRTADQQNWGFRTTTLVIVNERRQDIPLMKILVTYTEDRQLTATLPDPSKPYVMDLRLTGTPGQSIKQDVVLNGGGCCDREYHFKSDGPFRVIIVKLYSLDRGRVYAEQVNTPDFTRVVLRALNQTQIDKLVHDGETLQPIFEPIPLWY